MKTLTLKALIKQCQKFVESLSHATYEINDEEQVITLTKKESIGNEARVLLYFSDADTGEVKNIKIYDKDGDVAMYSERIYPKRVDRGLYVSFKHKFEENEVE